MPRSTDPPRRLGTGKAAAALRAGSAVASLRAAASPEWSPGEDNRHPRCNSCGDSASILVAADERDLMNSKKKARTIKELTATNKELKKTLSGVRGQLTKTETKLTKANEKAERWKKETAAQRTAASRSDARVEKLQKKLDRAAAALEPVQAVGPLEAAASGRTVGEPTGADGLTVPDQTWTVVQLRAEARARGLVGMSDKSKAELLDALS
jgi:hypothetical protein